MKRVLLSLSIAIIFVSALAQAEIFLEQPDPVYNLGDNLQAKFTIEKKASQVCFLDLTVECADDEVLVKREQLRFAANERKNMTINWLIEDLDGECRYKIQCGEDIQRTRQFSISKEAAVEYALNNILFYPAEEIRINGTAFKENSRPLEGLAVITIEDIVNQTVPVKTGKFSFVTKVPPTLAPGKYTIEILTIEKNAEGEIISEGSKETDFLVGSRPSSIQISVPEQAKPPREVVLSANLLDQANTTLKNKTFVLKVINPSNEKVLEKTIFSTEKISLSLPSNAERGAWFVRAYFGDLDSAQPFYVLENQEISVELVNSSSGMMFNFTNKGNVPYKGTLELTFTKDNATQSIPLNLSIDTSTSQTYRPQLEEGYYAVDTGGQTFQQIYFNSLSPLTASAINDGGAVIDTKSLIPLFGVIALLVIIFAAYRVLRRFTPKTPVYNSPPNLTSKKVYTIFFRTKAPSKELEKFVEKNNLRLRYLGGEFSFAVFYSTQTKDPEKFALRIAQNAIKLSTKHNFPLTVLLNSKVYDGKMTSVQELITASHTLASQIRRSGAVVLTEKVLGKLPQDIKNQANPFRQIKVGETLINTYTLY